MTKQHIYADGVDSITYAEALVRMNLFCVGAKTEQGYEHEQVAQLLLSPSGFLRAYEAMGELIERMEKGGVITRRPTLQKEGGAETPPFNANVSPNFN